MASQGSAVARLSLRCRQIWSTQTVAAGQLADLGAAAGGSRQAQPQPHYLPARALHSGAPPSQRAGLFGILGLHTPPDFSVRCQDAIRRCEELTDRIATLPPSPAVVDAVDEISDTVCQVLDPASLCRQVAVAEEWRAAALRVCIDMEGFVQTLNTNRVLFSALSATVAAGDRQGGGFWGFPEQETVARALLRDFHLGGIHLEAEAQERVSSMKQQIQMLEMEFQHALSDKDQLGVVDLSQMRKGSRVFPYAKSYPLDLPHAAALLFHSRDEEVRRLVYTRGNSSPANNLIRIENLIYLRHSLATLTGFDSFAAYSIQPYSLAQTPEAVTAFLHEMATELRPLVRQELDVLQKVKGEGAGRVRHWDRSYLMAKARSELTQNGHELITEYLPLEGCLKGLDYVLNGTLGLRLLERPLSAEETWAPGVRKFELAEQGDGEVFGTIYLDMLRRPNKFQNAAHFNIRSGRRLSDGSYQSPVVALVCNFASSACLTLRELETLFHEFGHALHSMLSRTHYQHLAGIRGAMDCMEVPSHLWQRFATDPRILRAIGSHHISGDPIPEALLLNAQRSHDMFAASDLQQLVMHSLMDQAFTAAAPPPPGDSTAALARLLEQHTDLPLEPDTHPHIRFPHAVGYAANYYAYVYSQSIAGSLWDRHFARDPLCRDSGDLIHRGLLRPGGAVTGGGQLRELLGDGEGGAVGSGWAPHPATLLQGLNRSWRP